MAHRHRHRHDYDGGQQRCIECNWENTGGGGSNGWCHRHRCCLRGSHWGHDIYNSRNSCDNRRNNRSGKWWRQRRSRQQRGNLNNGIIREEIVWWSS
ncbi:hypothetical protein LSAT2_032320 [Lamellibrachia satsuma]|nr:hypothetical protein LSAT2_032320 [Lamellibrachia satsuma]